MKQCGNCEKEFPGTAWQPGEYLVWELFIVCSRDCADALSKRFGRPIGHDDFVEPAHARFEVTTDGRFSG